jgi:hypothetical protein
MLVLAAAQMACGAPAAITLTPRSLAATATAATATSPAIPTITPLPPTPEPTAILLVPIIPEVLVSAAEGATLVSSDGAITLYIPPGALAEDTAITISAVPRELWPDDVQALPPAGPVYQLEPDGLQFLTPAIFTYTLDLVVAVDGGVILPLPLPVARASDGTLELLPGGLLLDATTGSLAVQAQLSHFSNLLPHRVDNMAQAAMFPAEINALAGAAWDGWATVTSLNDLFTISLGFPQYIGSGNVSLIRPPAGGDAVVLPLDSGQSFTAPAAGFKCDPAGSGTFGFRTEVSFSRLAISKVLGEFVNEDAEIDYVSSLQVSSAATCADGSAAQLAAGYYTLWSLVDPSGDLEDQFTQQPAPPEVTCPDLKTGNLGLRVGADLSLSLDYEMDAGCDWSQDIFRKDISSAMGVMGFGRFIGGSVPYQFDLYCTWQTDNGDITSSGGHPAAGGPPVMMDLTDSLVLEGNTARCTAPITPEAFQLGILPWLLGQPDAAYPVLEVRQFKDGTLWYDFLQRDF